MEGGSVYRLQSTGIVLKSAPLTLLNIHYILLLINSLILR